MPRTPHNINDVFISSDEISRELTTTNKLAEELQRNLSLINQKTKYIFSKIKNCKTLESAENYFVTLEQIQFTLANLMFNYNINLPDRLRQFTIDFDNFEHVKEYYFSKIKDGNYSF